MIISPVFNVYSYIIRDVDLWPIIGPSSAEVYSYPTWRIEENLFPNTNRPGHQTLVSVVNHWVWWALHCVVQGEHYTWVVQDEHYSVLFKVSIIRMLFKASILPGFMVSIIRVLLNVSIIRVLFKVSIIRVLFKVGILPGLFKASIIHVVQGEHYSLLFKVSIIRVLFKVSIIPVLFKVSIYVCRSRWALYVCCSSTKVCECCYTCYLGLCSVIRNRNGSISACDSTGPSARHVCNTVI